jgi:hypothetical protein
LRIDIKKGNHSLSLTYRMPSTLTVWPAGTFAKRVEASGTGRQNSIPDDILLSLKCNIRKNILS